VTLGALELLSMLLGPLVLGLAVLRCAGVGFARERLAVLAFAHVAGSLALGLLLVLWLLCGAPLEARSLASAAYLTALALWLGARRFVPLVPVEPTRTRSALLGATLALLLLLLLVQDLRASLTPVIAGGGDEAQVWAIKGKVLFEVGALGGEYARRLAQFTWSNPQYPLLNPLLQLWVHVHAGAIVHVENRFPLQLAGFALLALLASALARHVRPWVVALLLLLFYEGTEFQRLATHGGGDAMAALGLLASVECALRRRRTGEAVWFRVGALSLAFLLFAKNEGVLYAAVLVPVFALGARRPARRELAWLLLPLAVALGTWGFNARFGFEDRHVSPFGIERLSPARLWTVVSFAFDAFFRQPALHNYLLGTFVGALLLAPRRALRGARRPLTLFLVILLLGLLAVYLIAPTELVWKLMEHSASRVFFQLVPVALVWLAMTLARTPGLRELCARGGARSTPLAAAAEHA